MNSSFRLSFVLVLIASMLSACGPASKSPDKGAPAPSKVSEAKEVPSKPPEPVTTAVAFLRSPIKANALILPRQVEFRQIEVAVAPTEPYVASKKDLEKLFSRSDLDQGEVLLMSKVSRLKGAMTLAHQIRAGFLGISLPVKSDQAVGGYLRAGMHVDLIITPSTLGGAEDKDIVNRALERVLHNRGGIILSNRRVLTVGRDAYLLRKSIEETEGKQAKDKKLAKGETYLERNPFAALPMKFVTLEVTPMEAKVLTFLRDSRKEFTIVARNPLDAEEGMSSIEIEDLLQTFDELRIHSRKKAVVKRGEDGPPFNVTVVRGQQIIKKSFEE